MNQNTNTTSLSPCGLLRRLAAIFYDCLLLIAVLFAATAILLPFTQGEAINSENIFYFLYLSAWSYLFFGWAWTHGGQTLGMRAWKIKLLDSESNIVTWTTAGKRFLLSMMSWAFMGLGFIWAIVDPDKLTFHDRYSGTRLYKIKATEDTKA
ncbi:MAG: RDD family protein [Gammaproteobacteria bacterium]|nr:RDD family protein [Gammaproteobacteria bacterium]